MSLRLIRECGSEWQVEAGKGCGLEKQQHTWRELVRASDKRGEARQSQTVLDLGWYQGC